MTHVFILGKRPAPSLAHCCLALLTGEAAPTSQIPAGRGACRGRAGVQVWEGGEEIFIFEPPSLLLKNKEKKNKLRVFRLSLWGPQLLGKWGRPSLGFPYETGRRRRMGHEEGRSPSRGLSLWEPRCGALTCDPRTQCLCLDPQLSPWPSPPSRRPPPPPRPHHPVGTGRGEAERACLPSRTFR